MSVDKKIALSFFDAREASRSKKATIHRSGKLGFTSDAINYLALDRGKYLRIARNEADELDENLYLEVSNIEVPGSFKTIKAGEYMYLNTAGLFDQIGFDYKNNSISFTILPIEIEGKRFYKLIKKERKRTVKKQA